MQRDLEAVSAQRQDIDKPWQESQRLQLQAALEDPLRRQSARDSLRQLVHCPAMQHSQQAIPQVLVAFFAGVKLRSVQSVITQVEALDDPLRRQSARDSLRQLMHCPAMQQIQQAIPQVPISEHIALS